MEKQTAGKAGSLPLLEPAFLLACAVLAVAAFGISPIFGNGEEKKPLDLRKPLGQLDESRLGPYKVAHRITLPAAVEESLNALDHVNWILKDTTITDERSPLRYVQLLVTYNSGGRDVVPHVPDHCYLGAGYSPTSKQDVEVEVPSLGRKIPLRMITFAKTAIRRKEESTVAYTFHCNGDFARTRNDVRYRIYSPEDEYAYFAKIEVTFGLEKQSALSKPTMDESTEALARFLNYVLPVLIEDHLPDWEAVKRKEREAAERKEHKAAERKEHGSGEGDAV